MKIKWSYCADYVMTDVRIQELENKWIQNQLDAGEEPNLSYWHHRFQSLKISSGETTCTIEEFLNMLVQHSIADPDLYIKNITYEYVD